MLGRICRPGGAISQARRGANAIVARRRAGRAAATILESMEPTGCFPAILYEQVESRILPAIEGLIVPYALSLSDRVDAGGPIWDR